LRWNALSSTRWKNAALPPDICVFGDWFWHQSEPDWHFPEKPIHLSAAGMVAFNALAKEMQ